MNLHGMTIGKYEIVEQIGRGGMATVYKARQAGLDRYVAIKVLPSDLAKTGDFRARFEREAKTIARLRHRNILTIFEDGRQDDQLYLVMEYVGGGTLQERLGWPQEPTYAVNIIYQVGDALAHAHRDGIIHRDVKPGNVLMAAEDWPLLSDFGLAKIVEDSLHLTAGGASVGTPHYMSPEQARGEAADHRSDIYSLGVVLYEAVTGQRPFGNENAVAVIFKHMNDPIPSPRKLRSDLPKALEQVILKALAKSPDERYQQMDEFLVDLQESIPRLPLVMEQNNDSSASRKSKKSSKSSKPTSTPSLASLMPARKRSFPWTRLSLGAVLLLIGLLALLFFNSSMVPLISTLNDTIAATSAQLTVVPNLIPTERKPSPTVPQPTPTTSVRLAATSTPSPTMPLLPSPSATPTTPVAATATMPVAPSPTPLPSPTIAATSTPPQPTPLATKIKVWASDGAEMVFVPAGEFMMGSDTLGDDEQPLHPVYLDDFWLDRHEVTNERFARFIDETGYQTDAEQRGWGWVWTDSEWTEVNGADWRHPRGPDSNIEHKMDHPVVLVSWNDADAYCRWAGKHLPSEAQWEKAARGPALEKEYAWGDTFDQTRTNTTEAKLGDTTPAGSFSPQGDSPYGAADLTGNVGEWVADWYDADYYSQSPSTNPSGPETGTYKVLRGGSWLFDEVYARTAFRYNMRPDYTYDFTGFRCSGK